MSLFFLLCVSFNDSLLQELCNSILNHLDRKSQNCIFIFLFLVEIQILTNILHVHLWTFML